MTARLLEKHVIRLSAALGGPMHEANPPLYYFYGPGGIGRSILMRQMMRETAGSQLGTLALDLRRLPLCSGPHGLLAVLAQTFGIKPGSGEDLAAEAQAVAQAMPAPLLIYFDHFEEMGGWEAWLYHHLILPTRQKALYVISGAYDLHDVWGKDGVISAQLSPFSADETNLYLRASFKLNGNEVPEGVHKVTEGLPLGVGIASEILTRLSGQPSKVAEILTDPPRTGAKALRWLTMHLLETLDSQDARRLALYCMLPHDEAVYAAIGEPFETPKLRFLPDPGPTMSRYVKLALRAMDRENYEKLAAAAARHYRSRYEQTRDRADLVQSLLLGMQADENAGYWQLLGVVGETIKVNPAFGEALLRTALSAPMSKSVKADLHQDLDDLRGYVAQDYKRAQRLIDRIGNVRGTGFGRL